MPSGGATNIARYVARRLAASLLTLVIVSLLIFFALQVLPGDAATAILGRNATPETRAALREELGLNQPAAERYLSWVRGLATGDAGESIVTRRPISHTIRVRLRNTLLLASIAALIGVPLAIGFGVVAGLMRDRVPDLILSTVALLGTSVPEFVLCSLFIMFFALRWGLFPAVTTVDADAPIQDLLPYVWLPALVLIVVMIAYIMRMVRTSVIDVMTSDYVKMAYMKGLAPGRVWLRHAMPSAALPTINATVLTLGYLVGGDVVVEAIFNYPGIGDLTLEAVGNRDLPMVQTLALLGALFYILLTLLGDLLMLVLSPRLRALRTA